MPDTKYPLEKSNAGDRLDETVDWLKARKSEVEATLALQASQIGEYLIERFFDGDLALVTSQNPNKNVSFRKLCEREDLPFSARALRSFIQVAINFRLLPIDKAKQLPPSHHSILYQVADPNERIEIGVRVADEGISASELRKIVKGKGRRKPGGGRKPGSNFDRNWKTLVDLAHSLDACIGDEGIHDSEICRNKEIVAEARAVRDMLTVMVDRMAGIDVIEHEEEDAGEGSKDPE